MRISSTPTLIMMLLLWSHLSCNAAKRNIEETELASTASTVTGLSNKGSHAVITESGDIRVIRSQAPRKDSDFTELKKLGITDVIIFKNETGTEVGKEIKALKDIGVSGEHLLSIPFQYKDFPDFETPCTQTVNALKAINAVRNKTSRKLLFHCTVGEDRTGYLAGLVRLLEGDDIKGVFKTEMCANGYSSGNPGKPRSVTAEIDSDLTPVFMRMAFMIQQGDLSWTKLNTSVCKKDPGQTTTFTADPLLSNEKNFRCKTH